MNPVRSLGPAIAAHNFKSLWLYMVAPVMGMVAGATAYTIVRLNVEPAPPGGLPVRSFRR